jgi:predicted pyridoxine 5'-phosphate oxidase superfamily flavin-nucleotide-binding protein
MINKAITADIMQTFQGVAPTIICTASASGVPNATYISQVFYVDDSHLALSHQFFNKTKRNIVENPILCAMVINPISYSRYKLMLRFVESQTSGETFEEMALQLEVLASAVGKSGVLELQAADIYEILSIEKIV